MNREEKENIRNENLQASTKVEDLKGLRDISDIDRHEGDMNNGELGGNFTPKMKTKMMINNTDKKSNLDEQEAPLKNTDHAFVQVNKDGSPGMPDANDRKEMEEKEKSSPEKNEE